MARISAAIRRLVRSRAQNRCEYCKFPLRPPHSRFHCEHIVARQHGGIDEDSNLAFACDLCNLHKGPNLSGIDPVTGRLARLFNPRKQSWSEHFRFHGPFLSGCTPIGRATVAVLRMNSEQRILVRRSLMTRGLFPNPET